MKERVEYSSVLGADGRDAYSGLKILTSSGMAEVWNNASRFGVLGNPESLRVLCKEDLFSPKTRMRFSTQSLSRCEWCVGRSRGRQLFRQSYPKTARATL
jgi:hypothetical protein